MGLFDTGGVNMDALLGGINKSQAATMGQVANIGAQGSADINQQFNAARGKGMAQLAATGMNNSTINPSMGAMYTSEKSSALNRLMDSLSSQRAGILEKYGGMRAEANAIPAPPGMGWGLLGSAMGAGAGIMGGGGLSSMMKMFGGG